LFSDNHVGQSRTCQLNTLDKLEELLDNQSNNYWNIENGYCFSAAERNLESLQLHLQEDYPTEQDREKLIRKIKVGYHSKVGILYDKDGNLLSNNDDRRVTQVYCSALSCAYSGISTNKWYPFAEIVLEGMYEGTVLIGIIEWIEQLLANKRHSSTQHASVSTSSSPSHSVQSIPSYHNHIFLTMVGGGVFGNDVNWIAKAIGRAIAIADTLLRQHYSLLATIFTEEFLEQEENQLVINICHFRKINETLRLKVYNYCKDFEDSFASKR
jgi:hypothetical protein